MKFIDTGLAGAFVVKPEFIPDDRGFFARVFCCKEFGERGLNTQMVQSSISFNKQRGTLRGMHFQKSPYAETKLVRCTQGAIYDVIIDLRANSRTFTKWFGVELSAENREVLYVPEGFAHGFLTLKDNSEVSYQISEFFHSENAAGVRWDDPIFSIRWPDKIKVISERDRNYPDYSL